MNYACDEEVEEKKGFSKPKMTPEAKAIVAEAIKNIKSKPNQFNMSAWCEKDNGCGTVGCLAGHIVLAAGLKVQGDTVSYKAFKKKMGRKLADQAAVATGDSRDNRIHVEKAAKTILNSGGSEVDPYSLFHSDRWPQPFKSEFFELNEGYPVLNSQILKFDEGGEKNLRKRAALAVKRLRHFLKTGE